MEAKHNREKRENLKRRKRTLKRKEKSEGPRRNYKFW